MYRRRKLLKGQKKTNSFYCIIFHSTNKRGRKRKVSAFFCFGKSLNMVRECDKINADFRRQRIEF